MSEQADRVGANGEAAVPDQTPTEAALSTRLEALTEENERLRRQYAEAQRSRYQRTALGLATLGAVAIGAGLLFAQRGSVLFILGGIGLFGALLTYYLTPERFIAADLGEQVYSSLARNQARLSAELGLSDIRVYVPDEGEQPAWLFIPQRTEYDLPSPEALASVLVVAEDDHSRGVSLAPTGGGLYRLFDRTRSGPLASSPTELAAQVTDAVVEGFELADQAESDIDAADGRLSIVITNGAYGGATHFDEPIASFVAVTVANGLGRPVRVEVTDRSETEHVVTCYWDPDPE
ncbi:hypothetical protein ACFQE1_02595 [Halobium palmae]|uniref:DUF7982 domain-containing protein n=1 Tax=Halobium palmae TaxID=1776492 RepID=A0ABD5RV35_9EURY